MDQILKNMSEVTIDQVILSIKMVDKETPVMIWGEPGLGKTDTLTSEFEKLGYLIVPVLAGQSEPTDIQGIPFNFENKYAKYLLPWWGWLASNDPSVPKECQGPLLLFFDDIVTAHEQTQAAFFKLIDEKHLGGGLKIRENVRIVAAGNRVEDMSAATDMPKALCNRFMHFYTKPDLDTWLIWALGEGRIHPHIIYYLRKNPMYLSNFEEAKKSGEHAWASPRTWEMLSRALYSMEDAGFRRGQLSKKEIKSAKEIELDRKDVEFVVIQGCIGKLVTHFLTTIKSEFSVVTPEEIIKDPEKAEVPSQADVDRLWATVANLEHWMNDPKNFAHFEPIMTYTFRLPSEFAFILSRQFMTLSTKNNGMPEKLRNKALDSEIFKTTIKKWGDKLKLF